MADINAALGGLLHDSTAMGSSSNGNNIDFAGREFSLDVYSDATGDRAGTCYFEVSNDASTWHEYALKDRDTGATITFTVTASTEFKHHIDVVNCRAKYARFRWAQSSGTTGTLTVRCARVRP